MASTWTRNRMVQAVGALALAVALAGCANMDQAAKNVGDYFNLRNGFLNPSEVGRFDMESPWGMFGPTKPVIWPILEQLDVIDEPNQRFTLATDPLPGDLVVEQKEYVVGEGDILVVSVFELVTPGLPYERQLQVNELGKITLHNLEQVKVEGLTPSEIEAKIGQLAVEKGFILAKGPGSPGPQVSVQLYQSRARVFSVLGQVGATGTYNIIGTDFRLLDALALSRDVIGGNTPGMDYLYVIRQQKGAGVIPPQSPSDAGDPMGVLDRITPPTEAPATLPSAAIQSTPAADGPTYVRPLPGVLTLSVAPQQQIDLDAGLGLGTGTSPTAAPAGAGAGIAPAQTAPGSDLLNEAVGGSGGRPGMIYVDGKWVEVDPATTQMTPAEAMAAATGLTAPRVIRIPIAKLKEGDPRYNIVIRPGDIVNVPSIEQGEFYLMGHVGRPGVYSLTGRKVTLKQAIAAAGGLDALAIPRRCELIRRVGKTEVWVQVDLQRIFEGEQPDMYLKADDLVNVGTDMFATFLAVTRNAYRASYGWGFVYDRNFYNQPVVYGER